MSGPKATLTPDAARVLRGLTERLKADAAPPCRLTATEERLLAIAKVIFIECVICVRANVVEKTGEATDRVPVTEVITAEAARLALAAAIEIEAPLRAIREQMEVRR